METYIDKEPHNVISTKMFIAISHIDTDYDENHDSLLHVYNISRNSMVKHSLLCEQIFTSNNKCILTFWNNNYLTESAES